MTTLLTTEQAAVALGIGRQRVWQKIKNGQLKATQVGHAYLIDAKDLDKYKAARDKKRQAPAGK